MKPNSQYKLILYLFLALETALGVKLDNMSEGGQYHTAISALQEVCVERVCNPLLFFNIPFYIFGNYRKKVTNLKIAQDFSNKIIERRRKLFKHRKIEKHDEEFGQKKRFALLDTLLRAEDDGLIDHQGISDEVNTFITAGYDTTAVCLTFTLLMLALHQDVQQRCYEELQQLSDTDQDLSPSDFNNLAYLECVIKESMRLFPPIPLIGRVCTENCVVNGLFLPKNTQIFIHIFDIMRDPRHFPNPTTFEPDRFLPENTVDRHPFAFNPFSAGLRNCIGQKFGMLEIKVLLVSILRNFKLLPVTREEDDILEAGVALCFQNSIKVKIQMRQTEQEKAI